MAVRKLTVYAPSVVGVITPISTELAVAPSIASPLKLH